MDRFFDKIAKVWLTKFMRQRYQHEKMNPYDQQKREEEREANRKRLAALNKTPPAPRYEPQSAPENSTNPPAEKSSDQKRIEEVGKRVKRFF